MSDVYLSRAGVAKLQDELKKLHDMKKQLSIDIGEAREKGDLKENAEYHSAKERLGEVMNRISTIDTKLEKVRLTDEIKTPAGVVAIGVKVTVQNVEDGDEFAYTLVGEDESDPSEGKISVYSPLAQGLLGKKIGEQATVELPAGPRVYKIIKTEPGS